MEPLMGKLLGDENATKTLAAGRGWPHKWAHGSTGDLDAEELPQIRNITLKLSCTSSCVGGRTTPF